jgi:magnesium-transporting ATPase (P-type)
MPRRRVECTRAKPFALPVPLQVLLESKLAAINKMEKRQSHALIIDGRALSVVLAKGLTGTFMAVGGKCKAVMCCRVSPLQKAEVTALVQHHG